MPPVGFDFTISTGERPNNYALDRVATGTGIQKVYTSLLQTHFHLLLKIMQFL